MTTASSPAAEFSIAQILLLGFRKAAIVGPYQNLSLEQQSWGAQELQAIVDKLATKGLFAKVIEFTYVNVVAGTTQYTMDADAIDIIGAGMFIDPNADGSLAPNQGDGETPVIPMLREEWQTLSTKTTTSRPVKYYLHRDASPPVAYIWPVPSASENNGKIRFEKHRLRASNLDASKTPDFERYWVQYFTYAVAHEVSLGSALPMDRVQYLAVKAEQHLADCLSYSKQRPNQRFVVRHGY